MAIASSVRIDWRNLGRNRQFKLYDQRTIARGGRQADITPSAPEAP